MTTKLSKDVVAPESVGVDPELLALFLARCRLDVDAGRLPSVQVAVARHGRLVAFETYGDATNGHKYILQSVGRNLMAAVVWKLLSDEVLRTDERVADVVPEFATNGKEVVTVEHVLTHTAGFPFAPLRFPTMASRAGRLEAFAKWRLDWEPGSRLQFHLTSAGWVIAELVERRTGLTYAEFVRDEICAPLGLDFVLPLPADRFADVLAVPRETDRTSDDQEVDPWGPWFLNDPDVLAAGEPSHSVVADAADVALLGQATLGSDLWRREVVDDAIRPWFTARPWGDQLYGGSPEEVNLGLFVVVSGEAGGAMFSPRSGSARTFGHRGAPAQLGFTDAETGTSFAYLTNGYPMAGYDYRQPGISRTVAIQSLGNDLVSD